LVVGTGCRNLVYGLVEKLFTGPKVDEQINKLENAADGVCSGTNPELQKYTTLWDTLHYEKVC
jgi:hypothetical protein